MKAEECRRPARPSRRFSTRIRPRSRAVSDTGAAPAHGGAIATDAEGLPLRLRLRRRSPRPRDLRRAAHALRQHRGDERPPRKDQPPRLALRPCDPRDRRRHRRCPARDAWSVLIAPPRLIASIAQRADVDPVAAPPARQQPQQIGAAERDAACGRLAGAAPDVEKDRRSGAGAALAIVIGDRHHVIERIRAAHPLGGERRGQRDGAVVAQAGGVVAPALMRADAAARQAAGGRVGSPAISPTSSTCKR